VAHVFHNKISLESFRDAFQLKVFILSTIYQYISGDIDSNSNTEWSQRHNLCQTVITKVSNKKPFVKSKQSLPERHLCVGCQLNIDQTLRLLCLKEHVRARGSTLWRNCWQEVSEFMCSQTPLFGVSWATKQLPQNPGNALSDALLMSRFQKFRAWLPQKNRTLSGFLKPCFARFYLMY